MYKIMTTAKKAKYKRGNGVKLKALANGRYGKAVTTIRPKEVNRRTCLDG